MTDYVLDASASVDLLLETATGLALQARLPRNATWFVPEHFYVEVSAAIRRAELAGHITTDRAQKAFADLLAAPLRRAQVPPLLPDAWARRGHLTMADAVYVVLAENLSATLVTSDTKLGNSPGLTINVLLP